MPKLNQILAIEKGVKTRAAKTETAIYHQFQKSNGLVGLARSYSPITEDGEPLPAESTPVQVRVKDLVADLVDELVEVFDVVATKEWANTEAVADIKLEDGTTLLALVPVTYLLFLEKQLTNLHAVASKIPTLDPTEVWHLDANQGVYATTPVETVKTKKVPKVLVKAAATDKHPAQTEVYSEDIPVGRWSTIRFSGALPDTDVKRIIGQIENLQKAVKYAREEANVLEVDTKKVGEKVLDYVFKP